MCHPDVDKKIFHFILHKKSIYGKESLHSNESDMIVFVEHTVAYWAGILKTGNNMK